MSGTCVRVTGVLRALAVRERRVRPAPSPERALELLAEAPGVEVVDVPTPLRPPARTPASWGASADQAAPEGHGLAMFISNDNLRKGAASTIQIAELPAAELPDRRQAGIA